MCGVWGEGEREGALLGMVGVGAEMTLSVLQSVHMVTVVACGRQNAPRQVMCGSRCVEQQC